MSVNKNDKLKKIKKLKKSHIPRTIIFCVIMALVADVLISLFCSVFISYVFNRKISEEYQKISYMASMYENDKSDDGSIFDLLQQEGRTFFITDSDGNTVYQYGDNTIGNTTGILDMTIFTPDQRIETKPVKVYLDTMTDRIMTVEDGELKLNVGETFLYALKVQEQSNILIGKNHTSLEMPLWIALDIKDGQVFYGQALYVITISDVGFLVGFVLIGIAIVLLFIILVVSNLLSHLSTRKRLKKALFTDTVTRGQNWISFLYKGDQILTRRSASKTGYAVVNLEFVKYRNYCICHSVLEGEEMLRKIDSVLSKNTNSKKEIAAHYASSDFAMLLNFTNPDELKPRLEKIVSELEAIDKIHRSAFHVGVYTLEVPVGKNGKPARRKSVDMDIEFNNAATARITLGDSDESGIAFFDEALVNEQIWIDQVLEKFPQAIANEEFVVYYQPKYDPKTNKLRGVEALIRWNSPDFGFKAPGTFIPILEKNGYIPEIDHYMIAHVARDQKKWHDLGYDCVPASVNVSRAHFIENDLAAQIRDTVDKEGAPHELIEIEITESAFFDDKKVMIETILKLKEYGFQVSMDDFGSGYSSLNSLKDMPLDVLKLDADFFRGANDDGRGEIVVSEAIKLAKYLNMITVAEGVEEKETVDFLAKQGCDMIQGYVYAKPLEAEKYVEKMKIGYANPEEVAFEDSYKNEVKDESEIAPDLYRSNGNEESSFAESDKNVNKDESESDEIPENEQEKVTEETSAKDNDTKNE